MIEETIKRFKEIIRQTEVANECGLSTNDFSEDIETYNEILNLIQSQQEEIEKKEKIIDEMSSMISKLLANINFEKKIIKEDIKTEELDCIKQYFEKKVEENDE